MADAKNETERAKPASSKTEGQPDPVLKQPEKSHMHSKDAHPAGDDASQPKKPA